MRSIVRGLPWITVAAGLALAGCSSSHFDPPEAQGPVAMVDDGGTPRMWALTKQEESRQVAAGTGRRNTSWRNDTFFHFSVSAFDPVTAKPLWVQRVRTFGDPEASGIEPSRVIGSDVDGRLLGQEGGRVWLLVGAEPVALSADDGRIVATAKTLQDRNPGLAGMLPADASLYGFDNGLVFTLADARRVVVRGDAFAASEYAPVAAPQATPELKANGMPQIVPMRPFGEAMLRNVTLGGEWIGLYTAKEATEAGDDEYGSNFAYPYRISDEGSKARRTFWRARIDAAQRFDDKFERLAQLTPVAGAPTFLKGRFVTQGDPDHPLPVNDPDGVLVWHSTRIDSAGRLALTRLDAKLHPLWTAELPLSETSIVTPVATWSVPGRLVVTGELQTTEDGVTRRERQLVSISLKDGSVAAANLESHDSPASP
ncbi:MAG: PA2928 family protein [Arenimonas sp.]